ncbi:MliC family protein [Thiorhodovibrio frisius]|uniref:Putative periplasmic protein n=1 Tax=Thiorhodovibrio frisius TaxID=631362 RepID=H8Z6T4_9GAMM|nr:MliC family protein [Thiorhodovibrio frisius]EIC20800.1 putative periplasmic protein [Thiorhodovibrio frisius]WPL21851.1 Membrane-bound lysozyme-inhibitor of c-type lysozyme [Thiorhodovibrio frisius]
MPIKGFRTALLGLIPTAVLLISADTIAGESASKSTSASELPSPTRIKWQCTEQPAMLVVVNAQGALANETQGAKTSHPVQIHAIKLEPTASGPQIPAKLISTDSDLAAPAATWSPGNSVITSDGHLRLDLTDKHAFLATNEFGNQTLFRRFNCGTAGKNAPVHYQCGPDFDLWVSFTTPGDGASDASTDKKTAKQDSAMVQYPGGQIELPQDSSGPGARYAQADSSLLIQGDSATFTLDGGEEHRCQVED